VPVLTLAVLLLDLVLLLLFFCTVCISSTAEEMGLHSRSMDANLDSTNSVMVRRLPFDDDDPFDEAIRLLVLYDGRV
jgi:hypothetical protein